MKKIVRAILSLVLVMTNNLGGNAQDGTHWQCDIYGYEYDMAVYFKLQVDDDVITDYTGYEVGAFVGDECRGVGEILSVSESDGTEVQFGYIRIRSNQTEGETMKFRAYLSSTDKTFYSTESLSFKNLELKGLPSSPYVITMLELTVEDVDGDGKTDDKDVSFLLEKVQQKNLADGLTQDGDSETCQQLIDKAKQDINNVTYDNEKSLDENKVALHEIVTQLEGTLETQRISDFNDYKTEQKSGADAIAVDGDSEKSLQLIATAKSQIDAIAYDKTKTPAENKPAVDAIIEQLKKDLKAQRDAEAADNLSFNSYKKEKKDAIDALALDDDSEACKELVAKAKETVNATAYDNNKTLEENKAVVDAIIEQLKEDLKAQRDAETADKAALESYQSEQKTVVDNLLLAGDSEASKQLVANAKTAIETVVYDKNKTLDDNKAEVDAIVDKLKEGLAANRAADKQAMEDYKKEQEKAADALAGYGDSDACRQIITDAKSAIETVTYDNNKTLDENKAIVDAIISKLKEDLSNQRNFERSIYAYDFTGTYDEQSHGIYINVPEGAYVKYGESAGNYWFYDCPVYSNAGTYIVYFEVNKDGLFPVRGSAMVTIEKASLTNVTLEKTELVYDTFGQQPQTVKITSIKAGTLDVPTDAYTVEGDTGTEIGTYTVKVTAKVNSNFKGSITATFAIVKEEINIDDQGHENDENDVKLNVTVLDSEIKSLRIDKIDVVDNETAITIPDQIRGFDVVEIADGAMGDETQITDIYLPNTKTAITIGKDALPSIAHIHTPLHLLDDYALMASLKPNYEAGKISAETVPGNKYWTFSCGVDVILPEGVTPYICKSHNNDGVIILELKNHIIKANNGVLIASDDNAIGNAFEITAKASTDRPSGMTPPTENAKSYEGNDLYPVIEEQHFNPSDWYILANNEFHELQLDDNSKVPACKAIMPRKSSDQARTLSLYTDSGVTMIKTIDIMTEDANDKWYDLQGRRLDGKPTKTGIYIYNGKKVNR